MKGKKIYIMENEKWRWNKWNGNDKSVKRKEKDAIWKWKQ